MTGAEWDRPLRVATIIDSLGAGGGGGEAVAREIATRLDRGRFEPSVCVTRWTAADEPLTAELRSQGIEVLALERSSRLGPEWLQLRRWLRERGIDIVHSHKFGSNLWASLVAPTAGVPVLVAHDHGFSYPIQRRRIVLDRWLIGRRADAIVTVCSADRELLLKAGALPERKVRFIPNGIEPKPRGGDRDLRAELEIAPGARVIGTVAMLRPQKGLDVLIEAAGELREEFADLRVLVAGGLAPGHEGERERLEGLIDRHRLGDAVSLLGARSDVPDVLEALDVAVLPSRAESAPLAVLEYMEAAKPVIASAVGGVPDAVDDGVTGMLVPPGEPAALASGVAELLRDPDRARAMGAAGQRRRRELFALSRTVGEVESLYEELWTASRTNRRRASSTAA
jgi:glycosyltransferase involved in cell wall biosynthesis